MAGVAARQHGVVTTSQLAGIGIGEDSIRRRVAAGGLHRLHRGVYAVGHPAVPFEGRCLAAVLALDPNATGTAPADTVPGAASGAAPAGTSARTAAPVAALSHRSAAELWGLMPRAKGPIHVTVATGAGRRQRKGLIVHRSRTLTPGQTALNEGVRVTTPPGPSPTCAPPCRASCTTARPAGPLTSD
ncbi:MAG: type IV toxin-antitoxin system AbiEi family antitoxin domain-containing protein [Gemmataceae bacterium]|nr:type IV toxin-antitoxin system AbiEi family antitoxin domain-containing protein [Gemmataceae bacterium]